jgi:hypothetical protein
MHPALSADRPSEPRANLFRGSRAPVSGVRGRGASRCGGEPQVLSIRAGRFAGKRLVVSEDRAEGVEHVLTCFLAASALAQGSWHLKDARDDPAVLVGLIEGNRQVDGCSHWFPTVARGRGGALGAENLVPKLVPDSSELSRTLWTQSNSLSRFAYSDAFRLNFIVGRTASSSCIQGL